MTQSRIYALNPSLTEEQVAVTFAMTSRSPRAFDEISQEVTETRAADFHEKWVLGYGHSSVAEHAVLHVAFEDISRVAADVLEESRLASYTEKSSRYQIIGNRDYHIPAELDRHPELRSQYISAMDELFGVYTKSVATLLEAVAAATRPVGGSGAAQLPTGAARRTVMDQVRAILPAAVLTNVGMTANARTMAHAISKLLSDPLEECRGIGTRTGDTASAHVPTLLKYADRSPIIERYRADAVWVPYQEEGTVNSSAELLDWTTNVMPRISIGLGLDARICRPNGEFDAKFVWKRINEITQGRGEYDPLPRAFELVSYLFAVVMDYGALREFRRHRMMTPISQRLTTKRGYDVPELFKTHGIESLFHQAMATSDQLYDQLSNELGPVVAQYAVTHAHQQEITIGINFREFAEVVRLRTSSRAHASIRVPVCAMVDAVREVHPRLIALIEPEEED